MGSDVRPPHFPVNRLRPLKCIIIMYTNVFVKESDIKKIGHTAFDDGGQMNFVCCGVTAGLEEILLRSILACFGDYRITEVIDVCEDIDDDLYDEADEGDILFMTNLPSEIYDRL